MLTPDPCCEARPSLTLDFEGAPPGRTYMVRAQGARCWDTTGREYLEFTACRGPILLGYADDRVDSAVREQMTLGIHFPMCNLFVDPLKEQLLEIFPWAGGVDLKKTGSDATTEAVRLARTFTGRWKIIRAGYHGWHDWSAQQIGTRHWTHRHANGWVPKVPGVPRGEVENVVYNWDGDEVAYVETLLRSQAGEFAAVIIAADELYKPVDERLRDLRRLTSEHGALFILDEVKTAFRTGLGGIGELYGVTPDLTTISKAMANGYPISAVIGRKDVMATVGQTHVFTTFQHDLLSIAAARKTIEIMRTTDTLAQLWARGRQLIDGFNQIAHELDLADLVAAEGWQWETMPFFAFQPADPRAQALKRRFHDELRARGVYMSPDHMDFIMAAHTEADLEQTLEACAGALQFAKE